MKLGVFYMVTNSVFIRKIELFPLYCGSVHIQHTLKIWLAEPDCFHFAYCFPGRAGTEIILVQWPENSVLSVYILLY